MSRAELKRYTGYDYMELATEGKEVSFLLECYAAFGWELDEYSAQYREHSHRHNNPSAIVLPLRRDRKLLNKAELTRLQRNFEACVRDLHRLEARKTSKATALALIIGFGGGAFAVGAILAALVNPPHILLSILLAIPALVGCAMPYPLYRRVSAEETQRVTLLMDQKYEEIKSICERGNKLAYGE